MTNTRKLIGSAAFAVALTGGGVAGALLGTPGTSGAQESTATTSEDGDGTAGRVGHRGKHTDVAAAALGMTVEELEAELEVGKTVAEVAAVEGVDVDTVIDALVAAATENIRERITARVNGERPERAHRHHHRHGPGPRRGTDEATPRHG